MADDLDDFFDDVEQAAAEAADEDDQIKDVSKDAATSQSTSETDETPKQHHQDNEEDSPSSSQAPPSKRQKTNRVAVASAAAVVRPKGVVVASSASKVFNNNVSDGPNGAFGMEGGGLGGTGTNMPGAASTAMAMNGNNHLGLHNNQPPLPPGPMPPPPPPPPPPADAQQNSLPKKPVKRIAAGKVWVDAKLAEWPDNDFRIFVGNLGADVNDTKLYEHFAKYASIAKARVICDAKQVSKGYGFVSFLQPLDCAKAIREMDQTWLGSRPIRVKRSDWKEHNLNRVVKQNKKQSKQRRRHGM